MTENITTGDILQMHDTQCTKGAGNTMSTVLGIFAVIVVLAILWAAYTNAREKRANTEAIATGTLGAVTGTVNGIQEELRVLKGHQYNDSKKLAYTDGALWGQPCSGPAFHGYGGGCFPGNGFGYPGFPGNGFGYGYGYAGFPGYPGHGGHGEHGRCDNDCGQKQQFREVRTFAETADNIEVINTCGPRV